MDQREWISWGSRYGGTARSAAGRVGQPADIEMRDMMTRRTVQHALLATLAIATAGAVMAARPGGGPEPQPTTRHIPGVADSGSLEIPEDLQRHRLKIRLDRELGARVLPNGQLFSMKGKDLTSLSSLLERLDVTLSPALSIPEADIQRARRRAERGGGGTLADLGATFWADAPTGDIERVARRLERAGEVEYIRFSRRTRTSEPAATPSRRTPTAAAQPPANGRWAARGEVEGVRVLARRRVDFAAGRIGV